VHRGKTRRDLARRGAHVRLRRQVSKHELNFLALRLCNDGRLALQRARLVARHQHHGGALRRQLARHGVADAVRRACGARRREEAASDGEGRKRGKRGKRKEKKKQKPAGGGAPVMTAMRPVSGVALAAAASSAMAATSAKSLERPRARAIVPIRLARACACNTKAR
jgi:hypothetical protein